MAPIDVNNPALPPVPIPPPPPDDDKDRDRDDRAKKPEPFLRVMRESVMKEQEKQRVQQDAAAQVSRERSEQAERVNEHDDRERDDSRRDRDTDSKSDPRVAGAKSADGRAGENSSKARGRSTDRAELETTPRGKRADAPPSGVDESGKTKDKEKSKVAGSRTVDSDALDAEVASVSKPLKKEAEKDPASGGTGAQLPQFAGDRPAGAPSAIPNPILRQAIEFAQFGERGGVLEFSLGLQGNVLGGAVLTIQSLGHKKIAIKLVNGRGGKPLTPQDLEELVKRMQERGIDVAEVEVSG